VIADREYLEPGLEPSLDRSRARREVLRALLRVEPKVLRSLARRCYKPIAAIELPTREHFHSGDWFGDLEELQWGHLKSAGELHPYGFITYPNLTSLKKALVRWMRDERGRRWNLCDNAGEPVDWIADAALLTLSHWRSRQSLPKPLDWIGFNHLMDHYWGADEATAAQLVAHEDFKGTYRARRNNDRQHRALATSMGFRMTSRISPQHCDWYAMQTFLGLTRAQILRRTKMKVGSEGDLTALSHGISRIGHLVGLRRMR
jgi:hypothetical protein